MGIICPEAEVLSQSSLHLTLQLRCTHRVVREHLLSNTGCAEKELAALSRSYRLYYSYKSRTD